MKRHIKRLIPENSRRRKAARRILAYGRKLKGVRAGAIDYPTWQKHIEPKQFTKRRVEKAGNPLISIVVPAFNTPDRYLKPLIGSVVGQTYKNWELCVVDASTDEEHSKAIKKACEQDTRINYVRVTENLGIAGNTNVGLEVAKGDYIGFADHDDVLSVFALQEVVKLLDMRPDAELIYSDEDKLSDDGKERSMPFFKPDWSPALIEGVNYLAHFVVVKANLVKRLGGLRLGFDGAQDYDFILRVSEETDKIYHIPKILYHWRMAVGSTARAAGEKNYADDAGRKALADHVRRSKTPAEVVGIPERPTNYRLRYKVPKRSKVSIMIPFKDKVEYLEKLIPSILANTKNIDFEIILISNNSVETETFDYVEKLEKDYANVKSHTYDYPFNFSKVNNFARTKANGDILVFLNNDTEVISKDWLSELVGVASQKHVGAVGPLLLYPDDRIQHGGVVIGMGGMAGHAFRFRKEYELTAFGLPSWPRNYIALTGACLAVEAKKFDEVNGFDETMIVAGSDVALCISLYEKGYQNVYWPFVKLYHYENVSVGTYDNGIITDYKKSLEYYKPYMAYKDPFFNKNLDLMNESIGIRSDYEEAR